MEYGPWDKLPPEILQNIFTYLDPYSALNCRGVCKKWKTNIDDLIAHKKIAIPKSYALYETPDIKIKQPNAIKHLEFIKSNILLCHQGLRLSLFDTKSNRTIFVLNQDVKRMWINPLSKQIVVYHKMGDRDIYLYELKDQQLQQTHSFSVPEHFEFALDYSLNKPKFILDKKNLYILTLHRFSWYQWNSAFDTKTEHFFIATNHSYHRLPLKHFVIFPNHFLIASIDRDIYCWDMLNRTRSNIKKAHAKKITYLAHLNSRFLLSGSEDKTIKLWRAGKKLSLLSTLNAVAPITCIRVISTNHFATGHSNGAIQIWDIRASDPLQTIKAHKSAVTSITSNQKTMLLVSGSSYGNIKTWLFEGKHLQKLFKSITRQPHSCQPDVLPHI